MTRKLKFLFIISMMTVMTAIAGNPRFVSVSPDGEFMLGGKPYRYVGANFWYGAILASEGEGGDRARLHEELDSLQALGIDNLRILAGGDGSRSIPSHIEPTLQKAPGVYDENLLKGLDYLLAELEKRDMRAVLYLNNAWEWSGGYGTYLEWAGHEEAPVPLRDGYDTYMRYASRFITDAKAKELFSDHVNKIVGRVNSITGKPYSESAAIMSWQIANEPRCFDAANKDAFREWLIATGRQIKSIDSNHLVSTGSEGMHGCEQDLDLWASIHNSDAIDYANIHIWPYNWGWVTEETLDTDLEKAIANTDAYVGKHRAMTSKPIVLEEFGFPRDAMQTSPGSPTESRDAYYRHVFNSIAEGNGINGANFWGWGGNVQPPHKSWQPGDPYTGDPAQEDQGLNSVFAADRSTMRLIKEVNGRLKNND